MRLEPTPEGYKSFLRPKPVIISNFTIMESYMARDRKGQCVRFIRFTGSTHYHLINAISLASTHRFRRWLLGRGHYQWTGGQRELDWLVMDIIDQASPAPVKLIPCPCGGNASFRLHDHLGLTISVECHNHDRATNIYVAESALLAMQTAANAWNQSEWPQKPTV